MNVDIGDIQKNVMMALKAIPQQEFKKKKFPAVAASLG
jgi:hypothetical protein